jgi:hypothetical protein
MGYTTSRNPLSNVLGLPSNQIEPGSGQEVEAMIPDEQDSTGRRSRARTSGRGSRSDVRQLALIDCSKMQKIQLIIQHVYLEIDDIEKRLIFLIYVENSHLQRR